MENNNNGYINEKTSLEKSRGENKDYPVTFLKVAEEVLKVVYQAGGKAKPETISVGLGGLKGGGLSRKIASAKRWGLVSGIGVISTTSLGMEILFPKEDDPEGNLARKKAFMGVKVLKEIYNRFGNKIPSSEKLFISVLVRDFKIPERDAKTLLNIYKEGLKSYLDVSNELDIEDEIFEKISKEVNPDNKKGTNIDSVLFELIEKIFDLKLKTYTSFKRDYSRTFLILILELAKEKKIISIMSHINNILTDFEIIENDEILRKLLEAKIDKLIFDLKKELGVENGDKDTKEI